MRVWHLALLVVGVFAMAAVLAPVFQRAREADHGDPESVCARNLKQLALAMLMYAQDYDDRLPPAAVWMDSLEPYVKDLEPLLRCPRDTRPYSYAMNSGLSGARSTVIREANKVVMLFESDSGRRNASGLLTIADLADPRRHDGGLFFAFAGGRVRGFTADRFPALVRDSAKALGTLAPSARPRHDAAARRRDAARTPPPGDPHRDPWGAKPRRMRQGRIWRGWASGPEARKPA